MTARRSFVGRVTEGHDLDHGLRDSLGRQRQHVWTDPFCWLGEFVGKRVRLTVEVVPDGTPEDPIDEVDDLVALVDYPIDGLRLGDGVRVRSPELVFRFARASEHIIDSITCFGSRKHTRACWVESRRYG